MRSRLDESQLRQWLQAEVTPASVHKERHFNAAVFLLDGTYLPCVSFKAGDRQSASSRISLLSVYHIAAVERSRFALPAGLVEGLCQTGETRMSWVSFVGRMRDGTEHWFGSSYHLEFFEMPQGYSADQLVEIFPHRSLTGQCYEALPFFECFVEGL